jgi:2,3-diketo-5-methylthio-1-phosphopentane phosphatase
MENPNIIYCDFDGTVTKEDSVNKFLSIFADKKWLEIEEQWIKGDIGSRECLAKQVALLPEFSRQDLSDYANSIEIDESFVDFYNYLKTQNIELVIVSDGFDFFIEEVLNRYNLNDIKFFANTLTVEDNKLNIEFNFSNPECKNGSGVCKCSRTCGRQFDYIGDGQSDVCIAKKANTLFAKNDYNLQKYCEKQGIDYISFNSFKDILDYFSQKGDLNAKLDYINN